MHRQTVVCDLDGCLANVRHRRGLLPNWPSFFEAMDKDPVVWQIKETIDVFHAAGYQIILCSGRPEGTPEEPKKYREVTEKWLMEHFVSYDLLFMRAPGDYRADHIVKKDMYVEFCRRDFDVVFVIDDRPSVVAMWRAEGLMCFQVDSGEWDEPQVRVPGNLTLLIGPSCAGKSLYASEAYPREIIVSSDNIREQLCGDFRDQSRNDQVFSALHAIVKARVHHGLNVVVDATNIRRKDRIAVNACAPKNANITYVVIDRPLAEKQRDAGWRAEVVVKGQSLIERHAEVFKMNMKEILAGDGDSRVTVITPG